MVRHARVLKKNTGLSTKYSENKNGVGYSLTEYTDVR